MNPDYPDASLQLKCFLQSLPWLAEFADLGKQGEFFFSLNRYLFVADKLAAAH